MKTSTIIVGIAALLSLGFVLWEQYRPSGKSTFAQSMDVEQPQKAPSPQVAPSQPTRKGELQSADGRTLFGPSGVTDEQLSEYLRQSGRAPRALLVAFAITKNVAFLNEALQKSPDDPLVLVALGLHGSGEVQTQCLDKLVAAYPDTAYPYLLKARQLLAKGDATSAILALTQASGQSKVGDFANEVTQLFTDLYSKTKNLDPLYAAGYAMYYHAYDAGEVITGLGHSLEEVMRSVAGNQAAIETNAAIGLSLAQNLQDTQDLSRYRQGLAMEDEFLKYLTASGAESYLNKPIGEYLTELARERSDTKDLLKLSVQLRKAGGTAYDQFAARAATVGEITALKEIRGGK